MKPTQPKPFSISKHTVWKAYKKVKANRGGFGIDRLSLAAFEEKLGNNLYRIWNRLSSGSYYPPPVWRVEIPKSSGGIRKLGIPTVGDRIAQMVVKMELEPVLEPLFHRESYGYRPKRSAYNALQACRQNCWHTDWVVDLDIKNFFDAIDHEKLMRAVRKHAREPWVVLYIERWLTAPVAHQDGRLEARTQGTPQGGVISPLLANLFLHYAFDDWVKKRWPGIAFERYADDAVCHCKTRREAECFLESLHRRFAECGLTLHPDKTKIVCSRDGQPPEGNTDPTKFTFLSYEFRVRTTRTRWGRLFQGFNPAMDPQKALAAREKIWECTNKEVRNRSLERLVSQLNPIIRGMMNYYGFYRPSEFQRLVGDYIDRRLMHWARRKYKRMKTSWKKAWRWLRRTRRERPELLAHWACKGRTGRAV